MASRFLAPFGGRGLFDRDPFVDLQREVNRLFDDSFRGFERRGSSAFLLSPKVDVCPTDEGWEITAELPGVDQKDIDLRLDGDVLTISGEKRDERKDEENRLVERSYGSFTRSFQLPFTPDADNISADCEKGVLTIKLPRSVEQERSKRISIRSAGDRTIEAKGSTKAAIGKDWKTSEGKKEQAEKRKGAPA